MVVVSPQIPPGRIGNPTLVEKPEAVPGNCALCAGMAFDFDFRNGRYEDRVSGLSLEGNFGGAIPVPGGLKFDGINDEITVTAANLPANFITDLGNNFAILLELSVTSAAPAGIVIGLGKAIPGSFGLSLSASSAGSYGLTVSSDGNDLPAVDSLLGNASHTAAAAVQKFGVAGIFSVNGVLVSPGVSTLKAAVNHVRELHIGALAGFFPFKGIIHRIRAWRGVDIDTLLSPQEFSEGAYSAGED